MVKYYRKIDKNEGTSLQIDVIEEHMEKGKNNFFSVFYCPCFKFLSYRHLKESNIYLYLFFLLREQKNQTLKEGSQDGQHNLGA